MELFDVVVLKEDCPRLKLTKEHRGTIVEDYNEIDAEVEFSDANGKALHLGVFKKEALKLVWSFRLKSEIK